MKIEILGAESLGVRSLCCVVRTANRQIVIDPGLALGFRCAGLLRHPLQAAAGEDISISECIGTRAISITQILWEQHRLEAKADPLRCSCIDASRSAAPGQSVLPGSRAPCRFLRQGNLGL